MNRDDVIRLMADAGLKAPAKGKFIFIHWDQIALLIKHEREACAQECDKRKLAGEAGALLCAKAIRARNPL